MTVLSPLHKVLIKLDFISWSQMESVLLLLLLLLLFPKLNVRIFVDLRHRRADVYCPFLLKLYSHKKLWRVITFPWESHNSFLCTLYLSNTLILSCSVSLPLHLGSLSHSECSSPSLITPPQSPLNLDTSSFASSQSQGSISTLPRISVSPVPIGERRKDRYDKNIYCPLAQ